MAAHLTSDTSDPAVRGCGRSQDPARAGAIWVAGTGAFLVVVAAAVFVAANWDQIPEAAKLGTMGLLTGGFLLAGRAVRTSLPGTAGALFHLGAFLIPVDVAALGVHLEVGWETLVLAEGLTGAAVFTLLDRVERSILFRGAAWASVVAASVGLGALTAVPASVYLAGAAVAGLLAGTRVAATGWALTVSLAPVATWVPAHLMEGPARESAAATGLVAAAVLVIEAHRRREVVLALGALVAAGVGLGTTWGAIDPSSEQTGVALAALFLVVELGTHLLRRDDFWAAPCARLGVVAEVLAVAPTLAAGLVLVGVPEAGSGWAGAAALLAAGWLAADLRRRDGDDSPLEIALLVGSGWSPATPAAAVCAGAAALLAGGPLVGAIALMTTSGLLLISTRPLAEPVLVAGTVLAPVWAADHRVFAAVLGISGATTIAYAAVLRAQRVAPSDRLRGVLASADELPPDAGPAWVLAVASTVPAVIGAANLSEVTGAPVALLVTVGILWFLGAVLDLGGEEPATTGLGLVPRVTSLCCLAWAPVLEPAEVAGIAGLVSALTLVESARRRDPWVAGILAISLPALVTSVAAAAGVDAPTTGVALVAAAAVPLGAALLLPRSWAWAASATTATMATLGSLLATQDPRATAHLTVLLGAALVALGHRYGQRLVEAAGGVGLVLGTWLELDQSGVVVADAYVAPVSALLLAVGFTTRRARPHEISSWVAYGLPVGLLGGAALLERIAGGGAEHALVAGAVAVVAVAVGGWRRLAAPLFLGTALVVGTAGYESLAVTAGIPTWAWLALGGTLLLGAGIAMERAATGPIETGRRLVDVISDRFE